MTTFHKSTHTVFGGNRGYVGFSKSKRAVEAEERGLCSISQMDRLFVEEVRRMVNELTGEDVKLSVSGVKEIAKGCRYDEWHHTSMYGNKTKYYSAETIAERIASTMAKEEEPETVERDEEADGIREAMATAKTTVEIDGYTFSYNVFRSSNGYSIPVDKSLNPKKMSLFIQIVNEGQEENSCSPYLNEWYIENHYDEIAIAVEEYNNKLASLIA